MNRRRLFLVALIVLAIVYMLSGAFAGDSLDLTEPEPLDRADLVQPTENGSYLWPYTSREPRVEGKTLAINLIIHGDDEFVMQTLTDRTTLELAEIDEELEDADPETYRIIIDDGVIQWDDAHGSTRYVYIDATDHGGTAGWVDESYQLHAGTYMGSRYHIRAYTTEYDDWTAIQIHQEYFDWFRLRHTVTDIQESRNALEADFIDQPFVTEIRREYHAVTEGGNDGWLSVIELVPLLGSHLAILLALLGLLRAGTHRELLRECRRLGRWSKRQTRGFVLLLTLIGIYAIVRFAGIALELFVDGISTQAFVLVLYPIVAVGPPLLAIACVRPIHVDTRLHRLHGVANRLGGPLTAQSAFGFAVLGLGMAFVIDFILVNISMIPIDLILHRFGLMVALGLVAAGAARFDEPGKSLFMLGMVGWIVGLLLPLLGYI